MPFREGTNQYWEYRWATLSRALLWAAGRAPTARITSLDFGDEGLAIRVASPRSEPLTVEVTWDHRFEVGETTRRVVAPGEGGPAELVIPAAQLPRNRRGPTVARVALRHADEMLARVAELSANARDFTDWARSQGFDVVDSQANFVLFGRFEDRHAVWQQLLDRGVLIRETGPEGYLRASAGTSEEMTALKQALLDIRNKE